MWKRLKRPVERVKLLKLLTLVMLTVLLGWVTYPLSRQLITSDVAAAPKWVPNDLIYVSGHLGLDYRIRIVLGSDYIQDGEQYRPGNGGISVEVDVDVNQGPLYANEPTSTVYIVAFGKVAHWLDRCELSRVTSSLTRSSAAFSRITLDKVPEGALRLRNLQVLLSASVDNNDVPNSVISIRDLGPADGLYCPVPNDTLWGEHNGTINFVAPTLFADSFGTPPLASIPGADTRSAFDVARDIRDHAPCVRIAASYPAQLAVAYRTSEGRLDPEEIKRSPVVRGSSWNDCPGRNDTDSISLVPDAHLGLTNLSKTEELNRTTFFAGVLAGVLGALAIEILNGTFDVAEHWSARRRTRHDEQEQRPEPTPAPPPKPDDEVDRDQLPLF